MRAQNVRPQQADARKVLHGRQAMFVAALLNLERGFGHVNQ